MTDNLLNRMRNFIQEVRRKPYPISDAIPMVTEAVDTIEKLQAEVEKWKDKYEGADMMAQCMVQLREDMISAGIITKAVPPMFMTEAILGYINKLKGTV